MSASDGAPVDAQAAAQAQLAAVLRLEQELDRMLESFAHEHGALVREACQIPDDLTDLGPVVVTTVFGHTLARLFKVRGRLATERLGGLLLDQHEQAAIRAHKHAAPRVH